MPIRRGETNLVTVKVQGYTNLRYGFRSKLNSSERTKLGQQIINNAINDLRGLVISPQSPKPARASGKLENRTLSGFCDFEKIAELRGEGFTITQPRISEPRGPNSRLLYVEINGVKYAWSRTNELGSEVLTDLLGVKVADENETGLIISPNFPVPPRVSIPHPDGGRASYFVDPRKLDEAIAAGWTKVSGGLYTLAALRAMASAA